MFEVAEIGHQLSKKQFNELSLLLHTKLLQAQFALKESKHSVIIILSGVEGAGKGEVVNRLMSGLIQGASKPMLFGMKLMNKKCDQVSGAFGEHYPLKGISESCLAPGIPSQLFKKPSIRLMKLNL